MPKAEPLAGVTVLVTRPVHQAQRLSTLIESAGGTSWRFPVLDIAGPRDPDKVRRTLAQLAAFDMVIFISPNAVQWGLEFVTAAGGLPAAVKVAAVGRGSARELAERGIEPDIFPSRQFNSEALLAMEPLQQVAGKRIAIFRGEGGRELLAQTLRERGADIEYVECYRRVQPDNDPAALLAALGHGDVDIITITSNDALENLLTLVGDGGRQLLLKLPLVVISERGQALAAERGFQGPIIIANQPSDDALLEAIIDWRSGSATKR